MSNNCFRSISKRTSSPVSLTNQRFCLCLNFCYPCLQFPFLGFAVRMKFGEKNLCSWLCCICFYLPRALQCSPYFPGPILSFPPLPHLQPSNPLPHHGKLPAVTHVNFFCNAYKMTSRWCILTR